MTVSNKISVYAILYRTGIDSKGTRTFARKMFGPFDFIEFGPSIITMGKADARGRLRKKILYRILGTVYYDHVSYDIVSIFAAQTSENLFCDKFDRRLSFRPV